jgi:hypothetical protein
MDQERHYYLEDLSDDDGSRWPSLVQYALETSEILELAARPGSRRKLRSALAALTPFLVEEFRSRWRWQCKQFFSTTFLRFRIATEVTGFIRRLPTLYHWNKLPVEDPSFYQGETAVLWTISHESYAFVFLNPSEVARFQREGFDFLRSPGDEPPTRRNSSPLRGRTLAELVRGLLPQRHVLLPKRPRRSRSLNRPCRTTGYSDMDYLAR